MKTIQVMGWGLPLCAVAGGALQGAEDDLNRVSINGSYSVNVKASFTRKTAAANIGLPGVGGPGTQRVYDDGFVGTDISGNAGGKTWNWSYKDNVQVPAPGTLNFHTTTSPADGVTRKSGDGGLPGLEVRYGRVLGAIDFGGRRKLKWGVQGGVSMADLHLKDNGTQTGAITGTTDSYAVGAIPLAPYAGVGVAGPGPLIPDVPGSRTAFAGTATSAVRNSMSGTFYTFTLGPFLELPLGERWQIDLGVGAVAAAARRGYSFAESTTITAPVGVPGVQRSGEVRSTDWLFGAGARLGVAYNLSDITTLELGVDYQHLGSTSQGVNGQTARLDLNHVIGFTGGVRWRF